MADYDGATTYQLASSATHALTLPKSDAVAALLAKAKENKSLTLDGLEPPTELTSVVIESGVDVITMRWINESARQVDDRPAKTAPKAAVAPAPDA